MNSLHHVWRTGDATHEFRLVRVPGTNGAPYGFGHGANRVPIELREFYIGTTPVTHALWLHVMGTSPRPDPGLHHPVDDVSWDHICGRDGFLDRINAGPMRAALSPDGRLTFRLPSESEWEYAARGGPHWRDDLAFSGSNNPDEVAWYGHRWTRLHALGVRLFGWRIGWRVFGRLRLPMRTETHHVALKAPNQLGIHDMSGNVWEWCADASDDDPDVVPRDGSPFAGIGTERRLRGGCHHNWDLHCRVWWRYSIAPDAHDGCIGFRLVLAERESVAAMSRSPVRTA